MITSVLGPSFTQKMNVFLAMCGTCLHSIVYFSAHLFLVHGVYFSICAGEVRAFSYKYTRRHICMNESYFLAGKAGSCGRKGKRNFNGRSMYELGARHTRFGRLPVCVRHFNLFVVGSFRRICSPVCGGCVRCIQSNTPILFRHQGM